MINKIKLNIISNRKLCENENLEKQIEKIFSAYERKIILKIKKLKYPLILLVTKIKKLLKQPVIYLKM